jgi:opine dehydrogenase
VPIAALPAYRTPDVLKVVNRAFPQFVAGTNVLQTSYDNIGMVFHPPVTMLNAAWIESHHDFEYYIEGISQSVSKVLERVDAERRAVAGAVGVNTHSAREWLYLAYNSAGRTLFESVQATPGYAGVQAPNTLVHRYLLEDVPMSLVPISDTGRQYGVPTPTIDAFIHMASLMLERDFRREGRSLERMGIKGMSVKDLRRAVVEGFDFTKGLKVRPKAAGALLQA